MTTPTARQRSSSLAPAASQTVPFLDLGRETSALRSELMDAVGVVLDSGRFLLGPELEAVESTLAPLIGATDVVGVASGTSALQLALMAHDIGSGDEVIVPGASFYATAAAVHLVGATPRFVDIDLDRFAIDPAVVEPAIGRRTRAIIAVHLYGQMAPMAELRSIADRHRLVLIEDMAQALGATLDGKPAGSWGDVAALSFYPTKNVGALGDAGAVAVKDGAIGRRVRSMRFLGCTSERDRFAGPGLIARMDDLQAALIRVKLRHRERHEGRRRQLAMRYEAELPEQLRRVPAPMGMTDVHHLHVVRSQRRDRFREYLERAGIQTEIHYRVPLHRQPLFADSGVDLPNADTWAREVVSLPLNPYLTDDEQDRIIAAANEFAARA
jgi:dTDP-4-amino-4,6-dideoxygalactose transaminase